MKKILVIFSFILISTGVAATEVSCGGVKYLSSSYPGASTKIRFSIFVSEKENSIKWTKKSLHRERSEFELILLDHDRTDAVFRVEGLDENGDTVKAFIRYFG